MLSLSKYPYHWISPFDKPQGSWFILALQSMGEKEYGISGHLFVPSSSFLKHLMMLLKCFLFFSWASFLLHIKNTDSMEAMKWKYC